MERHNRRIEAKKVGDSAINIYSLDEKKLQELSKDKACGDFYVIAQSKRKNLEEQDG